MMEMNRRKRLELPVIYTFGETEVLIKYTLQEAETIRQIYDATVDLGGFKWLPYEPEGE